MHILSSEITGQQASLLSYSLNSKYCFYKGKRS